jgi:tetratricopeptide (TPR) repeat protein
MDKRVYKLQSVASRNFFLITAGIISLTFLVYCRVGNFDFISFDDRPYVTQNPNVKSGLTPESMKWAFTTTYAANWHPLTWLSLMLDYEIFGLNAGGFHVTNLIFHLVNTVLLFWVFIRMTGSLWPSAFVAAIFALHPLHVESVAWIAERKDVLSTFFWFLTMLSYIRYVENKTLVRYLTVILFFILGLMSKPMLVSLPFVLLLLDYWPLGRLSLGVPVAAEKYKSEPFWKLITEKLPLFILSVISSFVTFRAQKTGGAVGTIEILPIKLRLANAIVSYARYLDKTIRPVELAIVYPHPKDSLSIWYVAAAAVLLVIITVVVIWKREHRWLLTGWLWYLGTLVPVIGVVQVGVQAMADRYTYIPMIGISTIAAWGAQQAALNFHLKTSVKTLAIIVLAGLTLCTWIQVGYWRDGMKLYGHSLAVTKNNYPIYNDMGVECLIQNKLDEAMGYCREAIRLCPSYAGAYNNLGIVFKRKGDFEQAISCFKRAIKINPNYADAYVLMANLLDVQGKTDEAIESYDEALCLNDNDAEAHNELGNLLAKQGKLQQAQAHFSKACKLNPNLIQARTRRDKLMDILNQAQSYYRQAENLEKQGNLTEAAKNYQQAIFLAPDSLGAHNNLAWIFATSKDKALRNPDEAIRLARKALELTDGNQPAVLDTLAAAYAASGKFAEAVQTAQSGVLLAHKQGKTVLAEKILARMALYEKKQPFYQFE